MTEKFWTEDRIEKLKVLWAEGLSASEIASSLRANSRNAVIGKAHRLGLMGRKTVMSPEQRDAAKAATRARNLNNRRVARGTSTFQPSRGPRMEQQEALKPLPEFLGTLRIPTRDLRDFSSSEPNQCRYIADEPPGPDYIACGNETADGESYCAQCVEILRPKAQLSSADRIALTELRIRNHYRSQGKAA